MMKTIKSIANDFCVFFLINIIYSLFFTYILELFIGKKNAFQKMNEELNFDQIIIFVVVPIFETFIFQYIFIWTFFQIKEKYSTGVIISSSAFSVVHFYNIYYVIATFGSGIILGLLFSSIHKKTNNWFFAFSATTVFHSFNNIIAHFLNEV